jgi:hypothetical protein
MIFDLIGLFIVPVLYCGYQEFRLRSGWREQQTKAGT